MRIILDDENFDFIQDTALEHIGPKMKNLESIFVAFRSTFTAVTEFKHIYPLLRGLQKCQKLSELTVSFDDGYGAEKLCLFINHFAATISMIQR